MGYQKALNAAGARVIDSLFTGSYQGTWGSIVEYNGRKGLVTGSYGSCSYCDAFQAEFDSYSWGSQVIEYDEEKEKYFQNYGDEEVSKEQYDIQQQEYQDKLAEFGKRYLKIVQDKWDIENRLKAFTEKEEDDWFDDEEIELYNWAIKFFQ